MTNAEKMAKDTERFAEILSVCGGACEFCIFRLDEKECLKYENTCEKGIKMWLESEAEDEQICRP